MKYKNINNHECMTHHFRYLSIYTYNDYISKLITKSLCIEFK